MSTTELLAIIDEKDKEIDRLKAEIEQYKNPPPNDWHSWIDSLLNIYLHQFESVTIQSEAKLGVQPPRADFVIVNDDQHVDLLLEIFDIFREHNIIEFKSPDDELSLFTLRKGIGYAQFYIYVMHEKGIDIKPDQVTLTFIRDRKPNKLLKELGDHVEPGPVEGIYYINWGADFPIQIIHSAALKGEKYVGLRTISDDPSIEDIAEMFKLSSEETDPAVKAFYSAYWSISAKLTGEKLEEAKRRFPEMAKTIFDIFKPEIDEKVSDAVKADRTANLFAYVQKGGMTADFAAKESGMTVDDFKASMQEAGYTVPETA